MYFKPTASAKRLAEYTSLAAESQKLEGRRRSFLRFLAKYGHRPEPADPVVVQNLTFLLDAFGLDVTDTAILELVMNAGQIANVDMFAANVCSTLRNPARSIGALIGVDPAMVGCRLATTAPLRTCGLVTINPAGRMLIGDGDDERMLALAPKIDRVLLTPYATMSDLIADIWATPVGRTSAGMILPTFPKRRWRAQCCVPQRPVPNAVFT